MIENTVDIFRDELNPGERIIWTGQPQQGFLFRPADIFLIPFSLIWGGFAIVLESAAISQGAPFFFTIWGIPFVLVGLYFIAGRFFVDKAQRSKTFYALTNERVIIVSGFINQNVKTLNLKTLSEINVSTKRNGSGTITFGATHPMSWLYTGGGWPTMGRYHSAPSFEIIEDAKKVYQQVKRLQREGV
jgi:hypothetical protein